MNAPVGRLTPSRAPGTNAGELTVKVARTLNDLMHVFAVRTLVYMGEQACPFDEEYDGNDFAGATHLILRCDGEPVGVVRLRWFSDFVKLERLAIRAEFRGGPGLLMLAREAVALAERKGYRLLMGHVQSRVIPFWKRYFKARIRQDRSKFYFSDYDYVEMEFDLHPPADAISIDSDPLVIIRPEGEWDRPGVLDHSAATPRKAA
ncbi:MAG TPA: GNAT family N-acetyltransferase [Caulobacteraceae bacterium]|nr:GNAT family N-acetyltransferase [Caulobacteraceae bacterium]